MSVPPTGTSSTTQPPIPVGDASKAVLLAAQAMTLPSVTSTSTSQYSAETLITILKRPSTSPVCGCGYGDPRPRGDSSR